MKNLLSFDDDDLLTKIVGWVVVVVAAVSLSSVWSLSKSAWGWGCKKLQGCQGSQGIQGCQGTQGCQGFQGTQGCQGCHQFIIFKRISYCFLLKLSFIKWFSSVGFESWIQF